eukprot:9448222-Pyramimonas_sp.AAC.1
MAASRGVPSRSRETGGRSRAEDTGPEARRGRRGREPYGSIGHADEPQNGSQRGRRGRERRTEARRGGQTVA